MEPGSVYRERKGPKMKNTRTYTTVASLGLGFTAWRLWERRQLNSKFVQAGVAPQDASIATAQVLPFFAFTRAKDIENTIESAALPGQVEADYFSMAEDLWLVAQNKAVT
jgi:hypothetical protein